MRCVVGRFRSRRKFGSNLARLWQREFVSLCWQSDGSIGGQMSWAWAEKAPDWRSIWRSDRPSARAPDDLSRYAQHPILFIFRYLRQRAVSHTIILAAVVVAVAC